MIVVKLEVIIIMDIKFSKVAKASLSSVPIVNGQIIVLTDSDEIYYDMNSTRRRASSKATASNYGIVKLSDSYATSAGAASSSVGASSKAVSDAYASLDSKITSLKHVTYEYYNRAATSVSMYVVDRPFASGIYDTVRIMLTVTSTGSILNSMEVSAETFASGVPVVLGHPNNTSAYAIIQCDSESRQAVNVSIYSLNTQYSIVILGVGIYRQ